jgi:hypothetical protein
MLAGKFRIMSNIPYETGSILVILLQMQQYLSRTSSEANSNTVPTLFNRFQTTFAICLLIFLFAVMIRIDKENITEILCFSAERGEKPKPSREGKFSKTHLT